MTHPSEAAERRNGHCFDIDDLPARNDAPVAHLLVAKLEPCLQRKGVVESIVRRANNAAEAREFIHGEQASAIVVDATAKEHASHAQVGHVLEGPRFQLHGRGFEIHAQKATTGTNAKGLGDPSLRITRRRYFRVARVARGSHSGGVFMNCERVPLPLAEVGAMDAVLVAFSLLDTYSR